MNDIGRGMLARALSEDQQAFGSFFLSRSAEEAEVAQHPSTVSRRQRPRSRSTSDRRHSAVDGGGQRQRPDDLGVAETIDKAHGRLEIRRIEVVVHLGWPGATQVMRIERTREIKGKASVEIAYFVTSLPKVAAAPARLLALARAHWPIENKLHWRRDVSMNKDRCRVRAGARPLASLRNAALGVIRKTGLSTPAARETFAEDRSAAVQAVTGRIL